MKKKCLIFILCLSGMSSISQQLPQFTQFNNVLQYINPATTGVSNELSVGLIGRHQWMGLVNSHEEIIYPRTYLFMFEFPIHLINSGVGMMVYMHKIGFDENLNIRLNYAYHIKLGTVGNKLSLGASLDMINQSVNFKENEFLAWNDIPAKQSTNALDAGVGIYFSNVKGSFAGVSAHNLLQSELKFDGFNSIGSTQYQFIAGTQFNISGNREANIDFLPSVLIKSSAALTPQYDVNAIFLFNEKFYGGLIYRYEDAIGAVLGMALKNIKIGLSYDYTISSLRKAGSIGSPEISLIYRKTLAPRVNWKSLYNIRDL